MNQTTLSDFRADRVWSADPGRDFPGNGYDDNDNGPGYLYASGSLLIELQHGLIDQSKTAVFHVELFGDDFSGTLRDCEEQLWQAALGEGMLTLGEGA